MKLNNHELIQTGLFINGVWCDKINNFSVINPATQDKLASVAIADKSDIAKAIANSQVAFQAWSKITAKQRSKILDKFYQLILDNQDDLALILTMEQGKPLIESKNEIVYGANYVKWYAEEARRINGYLIDANATNQKVSVLYQPVGVCAAITPWNFPNAMLLRKLAPALAAGCTMIAKPSKLTPLSTNALGYLANLAGIPQGVFNILHGDSQQIGHELCDSFTIRKITFTGSTNVGVSLYQNSAKTMKKLSLELGGNAPLIVFDDANIEQAVQGILQSKFRNAGQTCVCSNRVFIHKEIYPQLIGILQREIKQLKLGNGCDSGVQIGPLIDNNAVIHAQRLLSEACDKGAKLISGGKLSALGGTFFEPTLIECFNTDIALFHEEIFAPILAIYKFTSDDEVLELANQTNYGLASYVFTQNIARIYRFSEQLEYGMVGINTGLISAENVPFGGVKLSGLGREGGHSGIKEYLIEKYLCQQI